MSTQDNGGVWSEIRLARKVAQEVADYFGLDPASQQMFAADHTHEELGRGSASLAWEGSDAPYDWPIMFCDTDRAQQLSRRFGVVLEPINGCILAVIPNRGT